MSEKKVNDLYYLGSNELTKFIDRSIVVLSQIISIKHLIRPHYNAYSFAVFLFAIFLISCMNPAAAVVTDPGPGNYYTCDYSGCTANDLTVTAFSVTDANGNPLSCAACVNGIGNAYVTASVSSTAQNRYNVFLLANGHRYLIAATMNKNTPVKVTIPVTWNCGATNLAITGPGRCSGASGGPVITYSQQDLGANNDKEAQTGTPPVTDCHTGSKCYCLGVQTVTVPCTPNAPDFSICKGTTLNNALFIAQGAGCGGSGCTATYDYGSVYFNTVGTYQYTITCNSGTTCAVSNTGRVTVNPLTTITTQPSPQSTCSGGSVTFSTEATGTGTLAYQWYKQLGGSPNPLTDNKLTDTAPYSGTTSQTMTINPATSAQAGTYYVVATAQCGSVNSNAVLLTVNPLTTITTQPSPQSTCSGGSVTFSAAAIGTGTLTYQWYKQLGGSPNPLTDTKLSDTTPYSGTTSQTMTINPATSAQAGTYYAVATAQCGSVNSNAVTLTVNPIPVVAVNSATVCAGQTATLMATIISGCSGTPIYAWTGPNGFTAITSSITVGVAGDYTVVVTCSNCASNAAKGTLTVNPLSTITTQPSPQSTCSGGSATFSAAATGSGTLTYQWYKQLDGSPNPSTDTKLMNSAPYSGTTSQTMTINPATSAQAGTYYVVATAQCGSVNSNGVTLTVQAKPTASAGPAQTICAGSTVQLAGSASNYSTVTWSGGAGTFSPNANALNAVYTPTSAEVAAGTVTLTLTATPKSPCTASATSNVAITIQAKPTVSAGSAQTICAGSTVQLTGSASNYSTVTWSGGAGTFSPNANALNAVYTPTSAEVAAGAVTLILTANPKSPCTASATSNVAIAIYNPPTANFTATPTGGCGSLTIAFADRSEGNGQNITSWIWDFGDNKTYNGQNPSNHIYSSPGTYAVKLTVTNICGPNSKIAQVSVSSLPIVIAGTYGPTCVAKENITLMGTPTGGTWSGDGVAGNIFNPKASGVGDHILTYQYINRTNMCGGSNTTTITVFPLPQTTITVA